MSKVVNMHPNNVHWMDYRLAHKLPIADNSNCIHISPDNLRKLRAAVRKQGKKLEIDKGPGQD